MFVNYMNFDNIFTEYEIQSFICPYVIKSHPHRITVTVLSLKKKTQNLWHLFLCISYGKYSPRHGIILKKLQ